MKKLIFIALFVVGCSKPIEDSTLINKDGLMYLPDSDKPYTGEVFTNYSTGEKEYQGKYENGLLIEYSYLKKDGSVKVPVNGETLIDRGDLLYELNGQKPYTGDVFELYKDGSRKLSGSIKGGMKNKLWIYYTENGQIRTEENYKDGKKDGKSTRYYENGQIEEDGNYKNGESDGKWTFFYENGQIEGEGNFKDGERDGKTTSYYENGQIRGEENYKDGKLFSHIQYLENSQLSFAYNLIHYPTFEIKQNCNPIFTESEPWSDYNENNIRDEEIFEDTNNNGIWDDAEPFRDDNGDGKWNVPEPIMDNNGNGTWDDSEVFTDINGNGKWDVPEPFVDQNNNGIYDCPCVAF